MFCCLLAEMVQMIYFVVATVLSQKVLWGWSGWICDTGVEILVNVVIETFVDTRSMG